MWEWLVGYINILRSRGWGYGSAIPSLLTPEQIDFCKGALAIIVAVALTAVLVAFVAAGIYAIGYTVYVGVYNVVVLAKRTQKGKRK